MKNFMGEAKRYYDLGLNIHWIREKSKAPVESGWSERAERHSWSSLTKSYRKGFGVGVVTGHASAMLKKSIYLAMIDVDLKSADKEHIDEALGEVNRLFGDTIKDAPCIKSPYGLRYLVATEKAFASKKLKHSLEKVAVYLPSDMGSEGARKDAISSGLVSEKKWAKGWRVRRAWEIDLMSNGKQGVLPPSIHPDAGVAYEWIKPLNKIEDLPVLSMKKIAKALRLAGVEESSADSSDEKAKAFNFSPTDADIELSVAPDDLVSFIKDGEGVGPDKSAAIFIAAMKLSRLGFSREDTLTILTDEANFLGKVGYEHAKTKKRWAAARWVSKYTFERASFEVSPEKAFGFEMPKEPKRMSEEDTKRQSESIKKAKPWRLYLKRKAPTKYQIEQGLDGDILPTLENVVLILENDSAPDVVRRNEFSLVDVYNKRPAWRDIEAGKETSDECIVFLIYWLETKWGITATKQVCEQAIIFIACKNGFHPVKEKFEALPEWDGVARLDTWLVDYFGAENDPRYVGEVFRKWMVAAVARIYQPGIKFDWMIVLEGISGGGKTEFGKILFGKDFYIDGVPPIKDDQKDAKLLLQGKHLAEFGELSALRNSDINIIKSFLTNTTDTFRPPYGKRVVNFPRQTIFIGTTESDRYLHGHEVNRRFMPIKIGRLDFKQLKKDTNQLWAEALYMYEMGIETSLNLSKEIEELAVEVRNEKTIEDVSSFMRDAIEKSINLWKETDGKEGFNPCRFRIKELFENPSGGVGSPLEKYKDSDFNIDKAWRAVKSLGGTSRKIKGKNYWNIPMEN